MGYIVAAFFVMLGLAVNADKVVFQSTTAVMLLCFTISALIVAVEYYMHQINVLKAEIARERTANAEYGLSVPNSTDPFHRMEK